MDVLFIGNGINRYAEIVPGWEELFTEAVKIDGFKIQRSLTPTLEFDLNVMKIMDLGNYKTDSEIKKSISGYLTKQQKKMIFENPHWADRIHKKLLQAAPSVILTTNYDYFLELAVDPKFKAGKASTTERRYSRSRYREVGDYKIFHIHGENAKSSSICLGFEHYIGSIQYIREELTRSTHSDEEPEKRFHLYDVLKGLSKTDEECWYYHFFKSDVVILGFGLDAAEEDIWWLLSYRAMLMRQYPDLIRNKITYLEIASAKDGDTARLSKRKAQLEAFKAEVYDCTRGGKFVSYKERYEEALRFLKKQKE